MLKVKLPEHFEGDLWARLPKPKERLQGLSRTTLLEIIQRGLIHSVVIRKPGSQKGIRLINMASLLGYLESLEADAGKTGEIDE